MKRTDTLFSLTSCPSEPGEAPRERRRMRKAVSPSESVIRNLLSYSKALAVLKTNDTGYVNLVMN